MLNKRDFHSKINLLTSTEKLRRKMKQQGICQEFNSDNYSPVVIVKKKTLHGQPPQYRFSVDYRKLNEQIKNFRCLHWNLSLIPLARISRWYSTVAAVVLAIVKPELSNLLGMQNRNRSVQILQCTNTYKLVFSLTINS